MTRAKRAAVLALQRRRVIARALVEGPHSFHPPKNAKVYGWLEPTLRFVVGDYPEDTRSFAVFCDDSMNKYSHLFTPMVRIATWRREAELNNRGQWPLVDVRWAYLRRGRVRVDQHIRRLARALTRLKLGDSGIYDRRQAAPATDGPTLGFGLMVRTDVHCLELSGKAPRRDSLVKIVMSGCALLEEVVAPTSLRGWTECYDQDLSAKQMMARRHWKWAPRREPNQRMEPARAARARLIRGR